MSFKEISGQDRAIEFFRRAVNKDKLAHAYLFLGPAGVGKTLAAKNLAKFLNCQNRFQEKNLFIDCCDRCDSCRKIEQLNHPDVHWIEAGGFKKISIDEIRAMQKEAFLKAYEGRHKVFIIQEAQNMTEEAANSLLKTLEEPPNFSLIILTAPHTSGLLPTIVSRCQLIKFFPLNSESIKEILTQRHRLSPEKLHFLSRQAEGRVGQALDLINEDALSKKNRLLDKICRVNRQTLSADMFDFKDKQELIRQIKYLLDWFRDIIIFKLGLSTSYIINADRMENIKSEAGAFTIDKLERVIAHIDEAHMLLAQNANPKIVLELVLGRINNARGSVS